MSEKAKRIYLYSVMAMTLVPALFLVSWTNIANLNDAVLEISAVLGYIGIVFMLHMSLIGTRTVATIFFDDEATLLRVHTWLGKYGTLLIFLHPIFITIGFGESWLYSLIPNISSSYEFNVTLGRIAIYGLLIVWVSSAILRSRMSYRVWRYLHYLSYAIIPFALLHIPIGSIYAESAPARLYFWMVAIGFMIFLLLKLRDILMVDRTKYTVENLRQVSEHVYFIEMTPSDPNDYCTPQLGQYVYARLGFLSESHPFSVALYNSKTHKLSLAFKVYGRFTRAFAALKTGDFVWLTSPTGVFMRQLDAVNARPAPVFIAGGIGIVPFIGRIMNRSEPDAQLIYANQAPKDAVFEHQLASALEDRMISVYSRSTEQENTAEHGHVTAAVISRHIKNVTQHEYYICGPAPMMSFVAGQLHELGVEQSQIHQEDFTF